MKKGKARLYILFLSYFLAEVVYVFTKDLKYVFWSLNKVTTYLFEGHKQKKCLSL